MSVHVERGLGAHRIGLGGIEREGAPGVDGPQRLELGRLVVLADVVLGLLDDPRHGLDDQDGVLAGGGLAREHQGVGAVEDGVGDVGRLGAGGARLLDHRLEHLGRHDHRLAGEAAGGDDLLLQHGDGVERHLDPEVAAGDHQAVGRVGDLVEVLDRGLALDLGDDRDPPAGLRHHRADRLDVRRLADVARGEEVRLLGDGEGDVGAVLLGDLEGEVGVRQVDPLAGLHRAAVDDPRPHAVPLLRLDAQLDQAAVDQHPLAGLQVAQDLGIDRQVDVVRLGAEDDLLAGLSGAARRGSCRGGSGGPSGPAPPGGGNSLRWRRCARGGGSRGAAPGCRGRGSGGTGRPRRGRAPAAPLIPAHRPEGRHDLCSSFHGAEYTYL